jgi:hypothetical protein
VKEETQDEVNYEPKAKKEKSVDTPVTGTKSFYIGKFFPIFI